MGSRANESPHVDQRGIDVDPGRRCPSQQKTGTWPVFDGTIETVGRGDRIRTCDLYVPNVALYQAELHPDSRAANSSQCPPPRQGVLSIALLKWGWSGDGAVKLSRFSALRHRR